MTQDEYKHIDLSYLYEMADDDINFIQEMISDYIQNVPKHLSDLEVAFNERDFKQTYFIAHKIKSSFQFVGAGKLVEISRNIETHSQANDADAVTQNLETMKPIVQGVLLELQHKLSTL